MMKKLDRPALALALLLAAIAGFVDAIAFITLGQFFVSFMSGNSTRMAVGIANGVWQQAGFAGGLILLFVGGVTIGNIVGRQAAGARVPVLLALQAGLLIGAAVLHWAQLPHAAAPLMVIAMGSANAVFMANGEIRFGVTYMTGALARIGERLAAATDGGDVRETLPWLALWLSLVGGAVWGGFAALRFGGVALSAPAVILLLAALATRPRRRSPAL